MGEQAVPVAARRAARQARMRLDADRAARDGRIEDQVAAIIVAQQDAAAAEQALKAAQTTHAAQVAAADRVIGRAAATLLAERLSVAEVATVTGLGEKRIRRLARGTGSHGAARTRAPTPAGTRAPTPAGTRAPTPTPTVCAVTVRAVTMPAGRRPLRHRLRRHRLRRRRLLGCRLGCRAVTR